MARSRFTSRADARERTSLSGGTLIPVRIGRERFEPQSKARQPLSCRTASHAHRIRDGFDRDDHLAKLVVGSEERLMRVGEWSDWVPVRFSSTFKRYPVSAIFLKRIAPYFELRHPVNIDPFDPALPVSSPGNYAFELARATGRFYTQGCPKRPKR
jgi:hypothetical protein